MRILITEEEIAQRVASLGKEITAFYQGKEPLTVIALMNGALPFAADLVRKIDLALRWDTLGASSYSCNRSSGELQIRSELKLSVRGRHILLLDDIFDTGFTLGCLKEHFLGLGALSLRTCVLLNKSKESAKLCTEPDWSGFTIGDVYVIGYGMDSEEEYRNLPYIAVKE